MWLKPGSADQFWIQIFSTVLVLKKSGKKLIMFRYKFSKLSDRLRPFIFDGTNYPNCRFLSVRKETTCCLYYLNLSQVICMTAVTLGIHLLTVSKLFVKVCQAKANCESMPGYHI